MNLLICGHSYVRDLKDYGINRLAVGNTSVKVDFVYRGGAGYQTYLDDPELFRRVARYTPDIVLVILAGNEIKNSVSNAEIKNRARLFYARLRGLFPDAIITAAQVEPRFYREGNPWGCPAKDIFKRRRSAINVFLRNSPICDHTLMLGGPGRLDNQALFRDSVHLNRRGLRVYWEQITNLLNFIINKTNE